jgi:hypothetical protein
VSASDFAQKSTTRFCTFRPERNFPLEATANLLGALYKFNTLTTMAAHYKVFYIRLGLLDGCGHGGVCVCFEPSQDGLRFMSVNFTVEGGDKAHARGNGPKHQVVAVLRKLPKLL